MPNYKKAINKQSYNPNRVTKPHDKFIKCHNSAENYDPSADGGHVGTDTEKQYSYTLHTFDKAGTASGFRFNYELEHGPIAGAANETKYDNLSLIFFLQKAGMETPTPRVAGSILPSGDNLSGNVLHSKTESFQQIATVQTLKPQNEVVLKSKRKVKAGDTLKVIIGVRSPDGYDAAYVARLRGSFETTFWVYY